MNGKLNKEQQLELLHKINGEISEILKMNGINAISIMNVALDWREKNGESFDCLNAGNLLHDFTTDDLAAFFDVCKTNLRRLFGLMIGDGIKDAFLTSPNPVRARQWTGSNIDEILDFFAEYNWDARVVNGELQMTLHRGGKYFSVDEGSWIIRDGDMKYSHSSPDAFKMRYEPVIRPSAGGES